MSKSGLISTAEAAEMRGVSVRTIHRWVRSGALTPVVKLPGRTGVYLFDREDVDPQAKEASA